MKEIINFIEANVDGKTLFTNELVYKLENGALQGVYSDQISFSNLKYSQSGFQLDMFIVSNEKIWLIDKEGQREKLRKDFSAVSLFRFELAKRKRNDVLKLSEDQVLYRDQPIQGGRFKPVAFQAEHRFYVKNEKLHYEYDGRSFEVDTRTMQRNDSSDTFPPFISIEK